MVTNKQTNKTKKKEKKKRSGKKEALQSARGEPIRLKVA